MNPGADPRTPFDAGIFSERSSGEPAPWDADYAGYSRAKTRLAWREQTSLRTLFAEHPDRLHDGDIRVEGAVRHGHWIVGASRAQRCDDHAIAKIAVALFEAEIDHARGNA